MGTSQGNRLVSATATKRLFQPGLRLPGRRPAKHRARDPPRAMSLEASAALQRWPAAGCRAQRAKGRLSPRIGPNETRSDAPTSLLANAGLAES